MAASFQTSVVAWSGRAAVTWFVHAGYRGPMAMSERVVAKIRDLARLLNTDQIAAIERAVDELSERVSQSVVEARLADSLRHARTIRELLPSGAELDTEDLYDDKGLPR